MEVLNQHDLIFDNIKERRINYRLRSPMKEIPSKNFETMHPVASGDNMATMMRHPSPPRRKYEDVPDLVPCCEGKELPIKPELVRSGLSAISIRRASAERLTNHPPDRPGDNPSIEHRNSFRCLQRPDLCRVPHLRRLPPAQIEAFFAACAATRITDSTQMDGEPLPETDAAGTGHHALTKPNHLDDPNRTTRYKSFSPIQSRPTSALQRSSDN